MRLKDVLLLALSSLWQQKVRTVLNTLCVVFSTFVLVVSMSASLGVQETILREYDRFGELRRVHVNTLVEPEENDLSPGWLPVRGSMSDERRERLKKEILRRGPRRGPLRPKNTLNRARLAELAALPHVRSATPTIAIGARVTLAGHSHDGTIVGAPLDLPVFRDRVLAGSDLGPDDVDGVLVSEFMLYSLGVVDEDEAARCVGLKLRVDRRVELISSGHRLLYLLRADTGMTPAQDQVMRDIADRIPRLLETMDLDLHSRMVLWALWSRQQPPAPRAQGFDRTFTIRGVYRSGPGLSLAHTSRDWMPVDSDLALHPDAAEEMCLHIPPESFNEIILEVDDVSHVKEVVQNVTGMKLRARALVEQLELEQFIYRLVLGTMTFVALIALLVAGLGITNTLQMSVLQRTREIGILKAVGARDGHVLLLFLSEGSLVGLVGGLIGLVLAWVSSIPGDAWVRSNLASHSTIKLDGSVFSFPWWLVLGSLAFVWLATTLAAVVPAYRAARVDPVQALRHD
jgi:putative ABC transport system permease protein